MITLLQYQLDHVKKLQNILDKYNYAFDFSMMGTGKTYTASYISNGYNNVIVICPVSVIEKWSLMKKEYGINIIDIISYNSSRSVKDCQPHHGYLTRKEINNSCEFEITEKYIDIIKKGILLIVDEIQFIKNINGQYLSCKALIKPIIMNTINKCGVLLLSGSPLDKKEHVLNLFKLLNIMKSNELSVYSIASGKNEWKGFNEILNYSKSINPQCYIKTPEYNTGKHDEFIDSIFNIFTYIIKPHLSSCMIQHEKDVELYKYNYYCNIENKQNYDELTKSIKELENIFSESNITSATNGIETLKIINKSLINIETAKITTFARIAEKMLNNDINCRVIICVNYNNTISQLNTILRKHDPLILNGEVNYKERAKIISLFQSNTTHRIIIGNSQVCSTGIDLDDKNGNYIRHCLINPNYSTITLYQLSQRFYRSDTKSDAFVYFIFGKHACELKILKSLCNKSNVMKHITPEQVQYCGFPSDYINKYE